MGIIQVEENTNTIKAMEAHKMALIFPPMLDKELTDLTADIKANGLIESIVTLDGKVLDGVHRQKACISCGVIPAYTEYTGSNPLQFVISKNQNRRQLTPTQKAVVANEIKKVIEEEAKKNMAEAGKKRGKEGEQNPECETRVANISNPLTNINSRVDSAKIMGVSPAYVGLVKQIERINPELVAEMQAGKLTIPEAKIKAGIGKPIADGLVPVEIRYNDVSFLSRDKMTNKEAKKLSKEILDAITSTGIKALTVQPYKPATKQNKTKSGMYKDTFSWNPFVGCDFGCTYCKPSFKAQAKRQLHNCQLCYDYKIHEHPERLKVDNIPTSGTTVFVCSHGDISFCEPDYVKRIIDVIKAYNASGKKSLTFYFQSKRPEFFEQFLHLFPENVILVTTLETNRDLDYDKVSQGPKPSDRFKQFVTLNWKNRVVTAEPVLDFDLEVFSKMILDIKPSQVWLGYNSKPTPILQEPSPHKMYDLAEIIIKAGIAVKSKELCGIKMPKGVIATQEQKRKTKINCK